MSQWLGLVFILLESSRILPPFSPSSFTSRLSARTIQLLVNTFFLDSSLSSIQVSCQPSPSGTPVLGHRSISPCRTITCSALLLLTPPPFLYWAKTVSRVLISRPWLLSTCITLWERFLDLKFRFSHILLVEVYIGKITDA